MHMIELSLPFNGSASGRGWKCFGGGAKTFWGEKTFWGAKTWENWRKHLSMCDHLPSLYSNLSFCATHIWDENQWAFTLVNDFDRRMIFINQWNIHSWQLCWSHVNLVNVLDRVVLHETCECRSEISPPRVINNGVSGSRWPVVGRWGRPGWSQLGKPPTSPLSSGSNPLFLLFNLTSSFRIAKLIITWETCQKLYIRYQKYSFR